MLPLAVRPVRSLWLLCACVLLLPLGAAAGERSPADLSYHDYLARNVHAPLLASSPSATVFQSTADDAEDDEFDASMLSDDVTLPLAAMLLEGPPPQGMRIAPFDGAIAGLRSSSATLPFVPRPPPALTSF